MTRFNVERAMKQLEESLWRVDASWWRTADGLVKDSEEISSAADLHLLMRHIIKVVPKLTVPKEGWEPDPWGDKHATVIRLLAMRHTALAFPLGTRKWWFERHMMFRWIPKMMPQVIEEHEKAGTQITRQKINRMIESARRYRGTEHDVYFDPMEA
jgi:hypothetical protein